MGEVNAFSNRNLQILNIFHISSNIQETTYFFTYCGVVARATRESKHSLMLPTHRYKIMNFNLITSLYESSSKRSEGRRERNWREGGREYNLQKLSSLRKAHGIKATGQLWVTSQHLTSFRNLESKTFSSHKFFSH